MLTQFLEEWSRNVGEESRKTWLDKLNSGFWNKYANGVGLDIGYAGYIKNVKPILPMAIGIDKDYPGYNGVTLPFEDNSQAFVYSSHTLEHISNQYLAIQEWFRVIKKGGHMILVVPHRDLYEKKLDPPSRFNEDHKRFYQTSDLIMEIEGALPINSYRIRHLQENDKGHNYEDGPEIHGRGQYEIEIVVEKL